MLFYFLVLSTTIIGCVCVENKITTPTTEALAYHNYDGANAPTQIHLAFTGIPSEMMISYSTNQSTEQTLAKIKLHDSKQYDNWSHTFAGSSKKFVDGGSHKFSILIASKLRG